MTIYQQTTLALTKSKNLLLRSTIGKLSAIMSRSMSEAVTYVSCLEQPDIRLMRTYNSYQQQSITDKICLQIFVIRFSKSANQKSNSYDSILVIINWLIKMVYYKRVRIAITAPALAKVILNVIVLHYDLPDFIVSNRALVFISKFCFSLCYFLSIKSKLSIIFHPLMVS